MPTRILFITGTDTDIGKTVFAALLTRHLRDRGVHAVALKPIGSGSRADARALHWAADGELSLDEVNPWHFRVPLAPTLSARMQRNKVKLDKVVRHICSVALPFEAVIVEGAGGLLSPMGEDFDSRDLIVALRATPIVVTPNRLGTVNQVRLVMEALPKALVTMAQVVLVDPARPNIASKTNMGLLREFLSPKKLHVFPWIKNPLNTEWNMALKRQMRRIEKCVMP